MSYFEVWKEGGRSHSLIPVFTSDNWELFAEELINVYGILEPPTYEDLEQNAGILHVFSSPMLIIIDDSDSFQSSIHGSKKAKIEEEDKLRY